MNIHVVTETATYYLSLIGQCASTRYPIRWMSRRKSNLPRRKWTKTAWFCIRLYNKDDTGIV